MIVHKSDFKKLLSFYLDCLEDEDLRGLNFNGSQINRTFVLGNSGSFLLKGRESQFPFIEGSYFWKRTEEDTEQSERLFLGYPILLNGGSVSPLFFLEVSAKLDENSLVTLNVADSTCFLNHHIFGTESYDIGDSLQLQDELECEVSALKASLTKAAERLEFNTESIPVLTHTDFADTNADEPKWAANFILFRGGRSAFNAMLRRDITSFLKFPKYIDSIEGTALEALFANINSKNELHHTKSIFTVLNSDQKNAIDKALSQRLTVITGPPGTGKSQVVTNLLATCALNKKSVLFASKNNKAVDVVYEKLQKMLDKENWVLRLGNAKKITESRDRIMAQLGESQKTTTQPPDLNENLLDCDQKLNEISKTISKIEKQQELLFDLEKKIGILEESLSSVSLSSSITDEKWDQIDQETKSETDKLHQQLLSLTGKQSKHFWLKIYSFFSDKELKRKYLQFIEYKYIAYQLDFRAVYSFLNKDGTYFGFCEAYGNFLKLLNLKYSYYERRQIEKSLEAFPSALELKSQENAQTKRQIELYQQKLRYSWGSQIQTDRPRIYARFRRYLKTVVTPPENPVGWKKFSEDLLQLTQVFHVWIVTNLSARKSIPLESKAFDYVVIDEASQCDILSALPLLYRAKNLIVIGDPKQLKHISQISAKKERELAKKHGVERYLADWSYRGKSIYDVSESKLIDSGQHPELLSFHYRCHPDIIGFSNRALYGNKLTPKTDVRNLQGKFKESELGVFWHDVKGSVPPTPYSAFNPVEVNRIMYLIEEWRTTLEVNNISLGIVTPFRKQVESLMLALESKKGHWSDSFIASIIVGTAHRFQGDECDLIIFSPVVASGIKPHTAKWVASTQELLNVAVTRARAAFHVVGDLNSCIEAGSLLEELAFYIQNGSQNKQALLKYESPAEEIVGEILTSMELPFFTQVEKGPYRLDFIITTPFGNRINLEVDGSQHYTSENVERDEIRDRYVEELGYKVIRVNAKDAFLRREILYKRLSRIF